MLFRSAEMLKNQPTSDKLGYWLKTNQLGWLSVGRKIAAMKENAVPYRAISSMSAYKVIAFLIFDETQDIVIGETLDERDIIFWEVPDGKTAKLLAVTKQGDSFLVAFHELVTSGDPIQLEFKNVSICIYILNCLLNPAKSTILLEKNDKCRPGKRT